MSDVSEEIDSIIWNVYGKIERVMRTSSSSKSDLEFRYDAMGNRICKIVKPRAGAGVLSQDNWTYTYYLRDASGNVIAVYDRDFEHDVPGEDANGSPPEGEQSNASPGVTDAVPNSAKAPPPPTGACNASSWTAGVDPNAVAQYASTGFERIDGTTKTNYYWAPTGDGQVDENGNPVGFYYSVTSDLVNPNNVASGVTTTAQTGSNPIMVPNGVVQVTDPLIGGKSGDPITYDYNTGVQEGEDNSPLRTNQINRIKNEAKENKSIKKVNNFVVTVHFNPDATDAFRNAVIKTYELHGIKAVRGWDRGPGDPNHSNAPAGSTTYFTTTLTYTQYNQIEGVWVWR